LNAQRTELTPEKGLINPGLDVEISNTKDQEKITIPMTLKQTTQYARLIIKELFILWFSKQTFSLENSGSPIIIK
jgi:hypothetical protein